MIGQLGTTTDPTQLIPGSFAVLFADAQDLRARSREVLEEHDGPISRDVAAWVGDAAERCDVRRANVAKGLTGVAQVFGVAAAVLEAHAEVLRWGQGRAVLAIELWAAGVQKAADAGVPTMTLRPQLTDAFGNGPVIPEVDPGAILRRSAEHVLAVAWREVHASETAVCEVLDSMAEGLPDGNFHLEDFFGGIGEWVAGLAQLGWRFNPGRFLIDPAGMMSDSRDMGEGLLHSFDVDDEGYPLFLDLDTLHDNPGRWWGRAAPDIALAALPAGAAATRLLGSMELSDRFAAALRALAAGDDSGMIDFAAWLRREPIELADGTQLVAASAEEQAAAAARIEALPEGPLKAYDEAGAYQSSVFGPSERLVPVGDGTFTSVDGFTSEYGLIPGDAKLVSKPGSSFYIPETLSGDLGGVAQGKMDRILQTLVDTSERVGGNGVVEIVTNNAQSAAAWEARMRALNIPGYVRLQP